MGLDIGVVIPELTKYGGAERFLIECLIRWQEEHAVTLYAARFNHRLLAEAGLDRITCRTLSPPFEGENSVILNTALLPRIWEGEIGRHEVYHTHLWPTHLIDLHPCVWFPHEPLRLLYDLRFDQQDEESVAEGTGRVHLYPKATYDPVDASAARRRAELRALTALDATGRPDRVVANSRYMAQYLGTVYGLPRVDVVYPGVSLDHALALPQSGDIVLTIGQLWRHKRIRLAIEAIREVDDVQLYVVGSGPEHGRLVRLAERMGVGDRVFFLRDLDNHEVQILLARCLCVVFTPIREPFGIAALEALAAGKPLVAVDEGGFTEIVDRDCTFLVPPVPQEIARCIRTLQADPALAHRMGEHGRGVAAGHGWDRTARELLAIIADCHAGWIREHRTPEAPPSEPRPLIGIHYFGWYGDGFGNRHWGDNPATGAVADHPILGHYSSLSGDILARHIEQMEAAGADCVIANIHVDRHGIDRVQLASAETMAEIAERRGSRLRFAVNLCLYDNGPGIISEAVARLRGGLLGRPNYQMLRDRKLLLIFWTGNFDQDHRTIRLLKSLTADCLRVATSLRTFDPKTELRRTFGLFDAASLFSPLEIAAPENWDEVWQRAYDAGAEMPAHLRVATLSPGYDDSHLSDPDRLGNRYRIVPREDGATYRRTLNFALRQAIPPDLVLISTFNEFHESTHIEPSTRHGRHYLELTRAFVDALRAAAAEAAAPPRRTALP